MTDDLIAEFGTSGNVRFLDASEVTMYDSEGNELKCGCGRKANAGGVGKNSYTVWCEKCSPWGKSNDR